VLLVEGVSFEAGMAAPFSEAPGVNAASGAGPSASSPGPSASSPGLGAGFDPALLISLVQLLATSQGQQSGGSGNTQAQVAALIQILQHPTVQHLLQNPDQVREFAQNHPLTELLRNLQQNLSSSMQQGFGRGDAPHFPAGIPGLQPIIDSLQALIASAGARTNAAGADFARQFDRLLVQPTRAGLETMNSAIASGSVGRGIPVLEHMESAVRGALSGPVGFGGAAQRSYSAEVEQMVGMGFTNRVSNLQALRSTSGSVTRAVDVVLKQ